MSLTPSNPPTLIGTRVGEYEITARLGVGGMGVVYEGNQPLIGKRVAVKVLLPQFSQNREAVDRFLSEARAVNAIRHRGIVDIFSFGSLADGTLYFVMECLDGLPFDKLLKQRAPLMPLQVLEYAEEVLDALDAAHEAGIIHRDIKSSNLFLVDTGRGRPYVKLLDFGIAKLNAVQGEATPQTRASVIIGTPEYLPPEQARGEPVSAQTDLYSLGIVMYEMLTGTRPFKGENALQTMWMHVDTPAPKPSATNPNVPSEIDDLVLWALEKDPLARPASARLMRDHVLALRGQFATAAPTIPSATIPDLSSSVQRVDPPKPSRPPPLPTAATRSDRPSPGPTSVLPKPKPSAKPPRPPADLPARAPAPAQPRWVFLAQVGTLVGLLVGIVLGLIILTRKPAPPELVADPEVTVDAEPVVEAEPLPPKPPEPVVVPIQIVTPPPEVTQIQTPKEPEVRRPQYGVVEFRVSPFAVVVINGKNYGETPFDPIKLPLGKVSINLENPDLGRKVTVPFTVEAGRNVFSYSFR